MVHSHVSGVEALPMKRVLQVFTVPDSLRFVRGTIETLRRRGFDVEVATAPGSALGAFGEHEGVLTHSVDMSRVITPHGDLRALSQLVRVIGQRRPVLVHAQTPKGGLLGVLAAQATGTRVLYHMRGLPFLGLEGSKRRLLWATERISCFLASRVLCQSTSLRAVSRAHGLLRENEGVVLGAGGNGVDLERFDPALITGEAELRHRLDIPASAPVVGFVGRLVRDKGIAELLEAFEALPDSVHLLIVGPYESRDSLDAELRARLEAHPRARLVGEREDVERYYALMDILALPSYREGFPNVPLEAAAMGIPTVATAVEGCVDAVVDGVTGRLVPVRDSRALAAALRGYIVDPDQSRSHGRAARARVEHGFDRRKRTEELADLYAELTT